MWWLRYYLDSKYLPRDIYAKEESWEIMNWVSDQKIQSFNCFATVCYSGAATKWTVEYLAWNTVDESTTKAAIKTYLNKWYYEVEQNIIAIESGL